MGINFIAERTFFVCALYILLGLQQRHVMGDEIPPCPGCLQQRHVMGDEIPPCPGLLSTHRDQFVITGSEVVLNCTGGVLLGENHNSSHLFWVVDQERVNNANWVSKLDENTIQLHIPDLPRRSFNVSCFAKNSSNITSVCQSQVKVGDPAPENATITCTSHDLTDVKCRWKVPLSNAYDSTNWKFSQKEGSWTVSCKNAIQNDTDGICLYAGKLFAYSNPAFRLHGTNQWGNSTSRYTFDHYRNVILSSPTKLTVDNITNSTAFVSWDYPPIYKKLSMFGPRDNASISYRISLRRLNRKNDPSPHIINDPTKLSVLLQDLNPFTEYLVEIQCRFVFKDIYSGWGESKHAQFITLPVVPANPPRNVAASVTKDSVGMDVTLYWTGLLEEHDLSNEFHYLIRTYCEDKEFLKNSTKTPYFKISSLPAESCSKFEIRSANEAGESQKASVINVHEDDTTQLEIGDVIAQDSKGNLWTYNVSWKMSGDRNSNLILFWCLGDRSDDGTMRCDQSGLYLNNVITTNEGAYTLSLQDPNPAEHLFGIAMSIREAANQRIAWSACTILESKNPIPPTFSLEQTGATWIKLWWNPFKCDEKAVNITGYYLHVYNSNGQGELRKISLNNIDILEYNVTDLTPNTSYKFAISTKTRSRESAQNVVDVRTMANSSTGNSTNVLYVILPVLAGSFLIFVAGYFLHKRISKILKDAKKITIRLPEKLEDGSNVDGIHTIYHVSGKVVR